MVYRLGLRNLRVYLCRHFDELEARLIKCAVIVYQVMPENISIEGGNWRVYEKK